MAQEVELYCPTCTAPCTGGVVGEKTRYLNPDLSNIFDELIRLRKYMPETVGDKMYNRALDDVDREVRKVIYP